MAPRRSTKGKLGRAGILPCCVPSHSRRIRHRTQDPHAQQALLPLAALADLDLRLLHRARPADVRPLRAGFRPADGLGSAWSSSATGILFLRGRLPGCEPAPYIIRFTEDRPNPLYRRICYSIAWGEAITFAVLNIAGLVVAITTGTWMLKEIYRLRILPDGRTHLGDRSAPDTCRASSVDVGRGTRATLLLRHGVGSRRRAAGPLVPLPDDAEGAGAGHVQAARLLGRAGGDGLARLQGQAAAHASDRPRRTCRRWTRTGTRNTGNTGAQEQRSKGE